MKKIFNLTTFVAAAAMTVIACSKVETEVTTSVPTHRVTFEVGEAATKTAFSGDAIVWSTDDATRFVVTENGNEGSELALELGAGNATMKLTATFTASDAPYEYKASMAANRTGTGHPKIPTSQSSTGSTYDPDADILVARTISGVEEKPTKLDMQFARPAVINKMTLKGLVEGETINSITVSSDKNITGYFNLSSGSWSGQSKTITIATSQVVPASGMVTVYFVTMPQTGATLTVTTSSENYDYSKTFASTITFTMNEVTVFGVNMNKAVKANYSGTYALINAAETKMAKAWVSPNYRVLPTSVYKEGDDIYYDPDDLGDIDEAIVVVSKVSGGTYDGMYTIAQNGKYLYTPSATYNNLQAEDSPSPNSHWDITNTAGVWSIIATKSSNKNVMRYNSSDNYFACYASGQDNVALIPFANVKPTPVITLAVTEFNPTAEEVALTAIDATFNSNTSSVTAGAYSDAECSVASSWLSVTTEGSGASTVVKYSATANTSGERVGYIKITATNSSSHSVSKVITVTQDAGAVSYQTTTANLASWAFTSSSKPANNTDFAATSGVCTGSTFNLNGSGSTWNSTKGYAFTSVTDIVITIKAVNKFKAGDTITLNVDTYYNKESNAPMTGFNITASESGGEFGTTGLSATSWALSTASDTKTVTYTIQAEVAAKGLVRIKLTGTGSKGAGQGYMNNIVSSYTAN